MTDLAQWLATLDARSLERLTTLRPDVLLGAPVRDVEDLAERVAHPASVAAVVRELPTPALQVLEAFTALGERVPPERLSALLDPGLREPDQHEDAVAGWVGHLVDCAALWPDGTGPIRLNPGVLAVLDTPMGVGLPGTVLVPQVSAQDLQKVTRRWGLDVPKRKADLVAAVLEVLGDPAQVRRLAGQAPPGVMEVLLERAQDAVGRMSGWTTRLDVLDEDPPSYLRSQAAFAQYRLACAWAVENGLAFGPVFDPLHAELPSEVLLALAGPTAHAPFDPDPPHVPTSPVAQEQVGGTASAAVTDLLGIVMSTVEHLTRSPVPLLKAGGVGAREITRLAKAVGGAPADVRLALELTMGLGLLATAGPGRLGTDDRFTRWRALPPARRAADLLAAWVNLRYVPSEDRDSDGKSLPALSRFDSGDAAVAARAILLGVLHDLPEGSGATSVDALADTVVWRLPIVIGMAEGDVVRATLAEAERLGVVALGRLTAVGHLMTAACTVEELTAALTGMLPEVQSRAIVGSDLTVVVMGTPAPEVVDLLDAVAHREGRGQASTWRLTPASVRGALDAGYLAEDLLSALRRVATGDLPQALEYLVRDVARRHGHLQVRAAGTVVVGQDEALVAEVTADSSLRRLGLHLVAPTVLVCAAPAPEVLGALRGAGYLPVEVRADGAPVMELRRLATGTDQPGGGTAPDSGDDDAGHDDSGHDDAGAALARWVADNADPLAGPGADPSAGTGRPESPADLAARLLRGEAPPHRGEALMLGDTLRHTASRLSGAEIDQLAHAVVHGLPVRIRYRSSSGGITVRVLSDLEVQHGYLFGWCHLRGGNRQFSLANLLGVIAEPP